MIFKLLKKVIIKILNSAEVKENVVVQGHVKGLQNVSFEGANRVPDGCNFSGKIKVGYATTLGLNNYVFGKVTFGKYCQVGIGVAFHSTNHPVHYLSTYINKNLFDGELTSLKTNKEIIIGNDVWIGHGVIILSGVSVGDGAILAAGSVVTSDVAPYSIVAGVPAKEIKKRFTSSVITELNELQWWHKSPEELEKIKPIFLKNLEGKSSIYS